ncbi:MAG: site-2 protease family protein [Planctomycetes bacterium]|jgi:Zn-dependent protease|nr:site-2 protease family protein [Planctomycetota bacterium]
MSWHDRDYNRGGNSTRYFPDNPLALFNWSLPLGEFFGIRLRLHFWVLLLFAFDLMPALRTGSWLVSLWLIFSMLAALLLHEFGHHFGAQFVGGRHDDFLIGPFGNMIPPGHPPEPWPTFIANGGGIAANLGACLLLGSTLSIHWHIPLPIFVNPLLLLTTPVFLPEQAGGLAVFLYLFYWTNLALAMVNLLPFYWFDGAYLLQAILWPMAGPYRAINMTCLAGMAIAVPMGLLSLYTGGATGLVMLMMWSLLFFSSFQRWRQLRAEGPEILEQLISSSVPMHDLPVSKRRKLTRRWLRWTTRRDHKERKAQERIDGILAKVHEKGLHSLTWLERRALRRATVRERDRDLVSRR